MTNNTKAFEADLFFQELADNIPAAMQANAQIEATINQALATRNISLLLSLIPYIEEGEGHPAFQYLGETHRVLRILHLVQLEHKYNMQLFIQNCETNSALMEKYMLTLFAFRRLLFCLSEGSMAEAVSWLQQSELSVFAVYIMTRDELLHPTDEFYELLLNLYSSQWSSNYSSP